MAATKLDLSSFACACAAARRTARAITKLYDDVLREHDIEASQFAMLAMISAAGECTQAAIAEQFDFDKTTVSRNVRVLAKRKWISFVRGEDGRERRLRLTALGERRFQATLPAWQSAQVLLGGQIKSLPWDTMLATFEQVTVAARTARASM